LQYEWTLIMSPDGAETGTMVGKNTDTLKLTKVTNNTHGHIT